MIFLQRRPLFVLIGPTAVGKTSLSIEIAKKINGEIISADSMQVYKYLNIGTAKIRPEEAQGIPHHLVNIKKPTESFSVAEFKKLAEEKISEIYNKKKLPMLVGGTGLYVNSVINDYNFTEIDSSQKIRADLKKIVLEQGIETLLAKLNEIDPISAQKFHPHDQRRIIRALEVYYSTGKPISQNQITSNGDNTKYKLIIVGLNLAREKLYQRINFRVDEMLKEGWLSEIENLLQHGVPIDAPGLQGLGYKQLVMYLEGWLTYEEAVELIKRDTRRFAKRQLTWFNRDKRIYWVQMDNRNENEALEEILSYLGRSI
ncbi:MAG: tRNA delta(2)-isopentenylpyrophosphate transferase [Clostridiaceae bacterium BRH_c20a]|nr:MAG: tRNA delta(2)-isopentenylpyrophosphate transferase [Clostridiaceae bacterium BRH_c20a]